MNNITDSLLDSFGIYMTPDLSTYLQTIGSMWDETDSYVGYDLEEFGWSPLLDPDLCPAPGLPYLGQYVGERMPIGLTEVMQREWVKDHPNQYRGTLMSIVRAAQRTLTGARLVSIVERSGPAGSSEDYIDVHTYHSQTPDPNAVYQDLLTVVPADLKINYTQVDGTTWSEFKVANATWNAAKANYTSWNDVRDRQQGWTSWDRPKPIP